MVKTQHRQGDGISQLQNIAAGVGLPPVGLDVTVQLAGPYSPRFSGHLALTQHGAMFDAGAYGHFATSLITSWEPREK